MKRKTLIVIVLILIVLALLLATCGGGGGGFLPMVPDNWHHPASLADNISPGGSNASTPQTAMGNNGGAIIVWVQSDGVKNQIFRSEYRNGVWTHPTTTADHISPAGFLADSPSVAMDNNGNALIVWRQFDNSFMCAGDCPSAYKSELRLGSWSTPTAAGNLGVANPSAFPPRAAMDDNGNAIIVWRQTFGTEDGIFKSEYRNGVWTRPTSTAQHINPAGQLPQNPQVAMDNNGNAIIVWQESDRAFTRIYKSEYRNGTWHHPASLADNISPGGSNASMPQTAMGNNGGAIIVWVQSDGVKNQIFRSEYRNGVWTHPTTTADHISPAGFLADSPSVAMDNNGNALIVWRQFDNSFMCAGDCPSAYKSELRNGVWSAPSPVDNLGITYPYALPPCAAMDDNGNAIIVWRQFFGTGDGIFKSEYRNGVWIRPTSTAQHISPAGQIREDPQVAMGNNGNAIIVWGESDGAFVRIYKSEYR